MSGVRFPHRPPSLLFEKFGQHQPLNHQADRYAREGVPLGLSTLADQAGAGCAVLDPILKRIEGHVFAAERLHGDDTTVPVLAKGKTDTGRCWVYVRDDRPFAGRAPPAALFYYSRDRVAGSILKRISPGTPGSCRGTPTAATTGYTRRWLLGAYAFFALADLVTTARRRAQGETPAPISPLAIETVRRIDALFEIERSINGKSAEERLAVRQRPPIWRCGCASSAAVCYKNWKMYYTMSQSGPAGWLLPLVPYHMTQVQNIKRDPFEQAVGSDVKNRRRDWRPDDSLPVQLQHPNPRSAVVAGAS
jgi:Transposase IS66 family